MPIKNIHIITRLDEGGSAGVTLDLVEGLKKQGLDVELIYGLTSSFHSSFKDFEQKTGIKTHCIPEMIREVNPLKDLVATFKLYKILKKQKPQILHTHTSKAGIVGRLAGFLARIPVRVHSPHGHIFYGYFDRFTTKFFILIEKFFAKTSHKILNLTDEGRSDHIKEKIDKPEKFETVYCGIFLDDFKNCTKSEIRTEFGVNESEFLVGFVGRLTEIKGCDIFLKGAKQVSEKADNVKFMVVGDGELREQVHTLAKNLGISDKVIFTGMRNDIPQIFKALDVFVLTSRNEGLGRVLVEAMVSGIPIVASEVGGVPEVVEYGKSGLLFSSENISELSENILKLVSQNDLKENLISNGKRRAEDFEMQLMIDKVKSIYDSFL
ncbi:MAG: glycosyltransferase family 1 protein [Calditrichaeota bacterium]|nr:MAG: glycosyltransferase family 1 protein [Calditrichota bacterium]